MKPRLYIFVGYPGAGKTTVAKIIADKTGAVHLWADLERHVMFGKPTLSTEESLQLYEHLNKVAADLLREGKSVIFDTNFNYHKDRDHMRQIAAQSNAEVVTLWVTTPESLAKKRATEESEGKETRLWGNMETEVFERMHQQLQPPRSEEQAIAIDGTHVDPDLLLKQLELS